MDSLEKRIEQLERIARLHRLIIAALLVAVCAGAAFLHWRNRSLDLRAGRLSIVDDSGRTRVELGPFANQAYGLSLSDRAGRARALFELQGDGTPRLSFANPDGQSLAEVTVFQHAPRMSFSNAEGVEFFSLSVEMDGSSRMSLLDQNGRSRVNLGASGDGSPGLVLVDRYGRALAE